MVAQEKVILQAFVEEHQIEKRKKRQIMIAEKWQTASAEKLSDQADNGQDFFKIATSQI